MHSNARIVKQAITSSPPEALSEMLNEEIYSIVKCFNLEKQTKRQLAEDDFVPLTRGKRQPFTSSGLQPPSWPRWAPATEQRISLLQRRRGEGAHFTDKGLNDWYTMGSVNLRWFQNAPKLSTNSSYLKSLQSAWGVGVSSILVLFCPVLSCLPFHSLHICIDLHKLHWSWSPAL